MSGYRDTSNYEPYAGPRYGKPLRPYNWVQWSGVALGLFGVAGYLAYAADRLGWLSLGWREPGALVALPLIGVALINSRRETIPDLAPELAAARRRWLVIVVTICAAVLGVAAVLALRGA
jgi:hypothetical protein